MQQHTLHCPFCLHPFSPFPGPLFSFILLPFSPFLLPFVYLPISCFLLLDCLSYDSAFTYLVHTQKAQMVKTTLTNHLIMNCWYTSFWFESISALCSWLYSALEKKLNIFIWEEVWIQPNRRLVFILWRELCLQSLRTFLGVWAPKILLLSLIGLTITLKLYILKGLAGPSLPSCFIVFWKYHWHRHLW